MLAALSGRTAVTAKFAETPTKPLLQSSICLFTFTVCRPLLINSFTLNCCVDLGRAFLAIVWTTYGGIGPPAACDWLDAIFAASYTAEYLSGGTGQDTSHRRLVFYQSLHAALVRGCADMVEHLTPTSANLAAAAAVSAAAATTTAHQPTTPAP